MEMTAKALAAICKQHGLYRTAHLNDKLFANFKGFAKLANLEPYTGLKAVFLEGNALSSLDGLPALEELKCLYVQQNRIRDIARLASVPNLMTLDISNNELCSLDGVGRCGKLETLLCANNLLETTDAIRPLQDCASLQTLDLQGNRLADQSAVDVIAAIPGLKCLYLKGNPVVSRIKDYRKTLIVACPELTYLDDRPVFVDDREVAEAWAQGGAEAERAARERIRTRAQEGDRRNFQYMQAIRAEAFRQKRERRGLPEGDTDPDLDAHDDSEWEIKSEPEELVKARQELNKLVAASRSGSAIDRADAIKSSATRDTDDYFASVRENEDSLNRGRATATELHTVASAAKSPPGPVTSDGADNDGDDDAAWTKLPVRQALRTQTRATSMLDLD